VLAAEAGVSRPATRCRAPAAVQPCGRSLSWPNFLCMCVWLPGAAAQLGWRWGCCSGRLQHRPRQTRGLCLWARHPPRAPTPHRPCPTSQPRRVGLRVTQARAFRCGPMRPLLSHRGVPRALRGGRAACAEGTISRGRDGAGTRSGAAYSPRSLVPSLARASDRPNVLARCGHDHNPCATPMPQESWDEATAAMMRQAVSPRSGVHVPLSSVIAASATGLHPCLRRPHLQVGKQEALAV
jgi:hypothetical protein